MDNNKIIYYRIDGNGGFEDSFPHKPSKWEYTHEIVRMFTASASYAEWYNNYYTHPIKSCTFEELLELCPIPSEEIYDILFVKKLKLFNVFEEIKRNEETGVEWWEIESAYQSYEMICKEPARDKQWYTPYTYKDGMNFFKNWK